jgi:hypothetical protein
MKAPSRRLKISAALVVCSAGAIAAFGACKQGITNPPPPPSQPPPPQAAPAAPTNVAASATSAAAVKVTWTDNASNETGFKVERCSGAACTNFAEISSLAANTVSFENTGLTANTSYSYRVRAFNDAGNSGYSNTSEATTQIIPTPGVVMVGAGEITSCRAGGSGLTAQLIDTVIAKNAGAIVFTTGSNVSDRTVGCQYTTGFDQSGWSKFKTQMRVALTQRDFEVGAGDSLKTPAGGSDAVYNYWGDRAGERKKGWYSFDVGTTWHVIMLNSATWDQGAAAMNDPASDQHKWLAADLQSNTRPCIMAVIGHRRIYSGGSHLNQNAKIMWSLLYAAGADVVVSGWDKIYERYDLQDGNGVADPVKGIRQFIVGTGGRSLDALVPDSAKGPNLQVRQASTWGVLKLTLNASSYSWEFLPTTPGGFTDTGTTNCH